VDAERGESMGLERRKFERMASQVVGNCLISRTEGNKLKSNIIFTRDISCRGAKIVTQTNINLGERYKLVLHLPTCFLPMLVDSRVTWMRDVDVSKYKISNAKEAGVEFITIDVPDESKLNEFISFKQKQAVP